MMMMMIIVDCVQLLLDSGASMSSSSDSRYSATHAASTNGHDRYTTPINSHWLIHIPNLILLLQMYEKM